MPSRILLAGLAGFLLAVGIAMPATAMPPGDGPVLVFGGNSGTGLGAVRELRARKVPVTVFARPTSDISELEPLRVRIVTGDALDAAAVQAAFASDRYVAVISSLGGRRGEPRPDLIGNRNITAAARAAGVRRVLQVSSMGTGKSRKKPAPGDHFMAEVLYLKTLAEDDLIASGLQYTIIRPGGLRDGPATGNGVLTEVERLGSIDRNELGRLVAAALYDEATVGKRLTALDPTLPPPGRE